MCGFVIACCLFGVCLLWVGRVVGLLLVGVDCGCLRLELVVSEACVAFMCWDARELVLLVG